MTESICSMKIRDILKEAGADYVLVEKQGFHMVGRRCIAPYGGGAWEVSRNDGTIETMVTIIQSI